MSSRRDFLRSCAAFSVVAARGGSELKASQSPESQKLTSVGSPLGLAPQPKPIAEDFTSIQALMRTFMATAGVSAGQIAVARKGNLLFSHVFATSPPKGFSQVNTQTLFRIASCSKLFTCAAIEELRSNGKLDMGLKVFPALGIDRPAVSKDKSDSHIDEITVQNLVNHAGGWNDHETTTARDGTKIPGTNWDPVFDVRKIALDLKLSSPPTKLDIARYMYGKPLQFVPGTQDFRSSGEKSYSNFGYLLLGLIVENFSGMPYIDFIRTGLGAGSDTSNVYLSRLINTPRDSREVWYLDTGQGPTALKPHSSDLVPSAYGGGFLPELMDSAGGIMTNAETLATFVSRHAVWGLGGRAPGSSRSGSIPGTTSYTYSRPNGIDCAFTLNTRNFVGGAKIEDDFVASLRSLLDQL